MKRIEFFVYVSSQIFHEEISYSEKASSQNTWQKLLYNNY